MAGPAERRPTPPQTPMKITKKHVITFSCLGLTIPIITLSSYLLPGGEIYLTHVQAREQNTKQTAEQTHIVEVNIKDLDYAFFGTSFHLQFDPEKYEYDHFTLGSYFSSSDNPLVQVAQKDSAIIAGISLKRGNLITKKEGTLLKLFFKNKQTALQEANFAFTNTVFSTFDKERKNIQLIFTPSL
ncbi:hypothetical protein C0416_01395 [bacterium]|nr:hypothetical protein [bacterium]